MSFPDRQVRVFKFLTGKLYRKYDESVQVISEMQQAGTALYKLDDMEFGRRLAVERDLEKSPQANCVNAVFDESGNFVIYGTLLGIKGISRNNVKKYTKYWRCYSGEHSHKQGIKTYWQIRNTPLRQRSFIPRCSQEEGYLYFGKLKTIICTGCKCQPQRYTGYGCVGKCYYQRKRGTGSNTVLHSIQAQSILLLFATWTLRVSC